MRLCIYLEQTHDASQTNKSSSKINTANLNKIIADALEMYDTIYNTANHGHSPLEHPFSTLNLVRKIKPRLVFANHRNKGLDIIKKIVMIEIFFIFKFFLAINFSCR